jgi:hypothetical protein
MVFFGPIGILQWIMQILISPGLWFNLESVIPANLNIAGFYYQRPVEYGSPWLQPNAMVFLEPSVLSQFTALALLIEIAYRRRIWVMMALIGNLTSTLAGTGWLLILLSSPFLVSYLPKRLALWGIVGVTLAAICLTVVGVDLQPKRLYEFGSQNTSAYARFVAPALDLQDFAGKKGLDVWFGGEGAGSNDTYATGLSWAMVKLVLEYGAAAAVVFYIFLVYCLFVGGEKILVTWGLFILYSFLSGALLVPAYGILCMVLGVMLRVLPRSPQGVSIDRRLKLWLSSGSP